MRATEGRECASRFEKFESAEMDLFVAAQSIGNRGAIASEGRRVEDNEIPARNDLFVRFGSGLSFEPVENIHGFKRAFIGEAVGSRVSGRGSNGVSALVQEMNPGGTRARSVKAESTEETEAVENLQGTVRTPPHLGGFKIGDELIIKLLVEIETGLVASP